MRKKVSRNLLIVNMQIERIFLGIGGKETISQRKLESE